MALFGNSSCDPSQGNVNLIDCFKLNLRGDNVADYYDTPTDLINLVVRNGFILAGIILFGLVIFAGFKLVQGGSKGMEDAKKILTGAVVGFIVMFAAYWVIQILEVVTGANIVL